MVETVKFLIVEPSPLPILKDDYNEINNLINNLGLVPRFFLICIVFYCIVLKGWSLLPNVLTPFEIYCAPPNLGIIRT